MLGVTIFLQMLEICIATDSKKKITEDFRRIYHFLNEISFRKLFLGCFFISNLQHPLAKCEFNGCELYMNLSYISIIYTCGDMNNY